jgi:hypothetical protein
MDQILRPTNPQNYERDYEITPEKASLVRETFYNYYDNGEGPLAKQLIPLGPTAWDYIQRRTIHLWDGEGGKEAVYGILKIVIEDQKEITYAGFREAFKYKDIDKLRDVNRKLVKRINEIEEYLVKIYDLKRDIRILIRLGKKYAARDYKGDNSCFEQRRLKNLAKLLDLIEVWRFWRWLPRNKKP